MLRLSTAGESHGPALVGILTGLPAGLVLDREAIDADLARRQQGYGRSPRQKIEQDRVEVLAGLRRGRTLGTPLALVVNNRDHENWRWGMSPWPPEVSEADLVVHATSVKDDVIVALRPGQTLVDLPYPNSATAVAARAAGARVLDGREVLVAQGAASFELWTGVPAPVEVMRRAVGLPGASTLDSG